MEDLDFKMFSLENIYDNVNLVDFMCLRKTGCIKHVDKALLIGMSAKLVFHFVCTGSSVTLLNFVIITSLKLIGPVVQILLVTF